MTGDHGWRIRLTTTAESDLRNILRWTAEQFGHAQARIYSETLSAPSRLSLMDRMSLVRSNATASRRA